MVCGQGLPKPLLLARTSRGDGDVMFDGDCESNRGVEVDGATPTQMRSVKSREETGF